jgi:hypothetical protein
MARSLFGGRKDPTQLGGATDRQHPPDTAARSDGQGLDLPALAYAMSNAATESDAATANAEAELLERVAAFRSAVADQLFETSSDYQILCNLMHENLASCDETIDELRRRLTGNLHYTVLAKLDEMHAMVAEHLDRK